MKKILFLLTFLSIAAFAQEKKYQSLFWEISGNGLTKKSYMYGTMHVSDKVSFHLSDSFFEKLLASDFVANESEPNTWTELYDLYGFYRSTQTKRAFYSNFYTNPIEKDNLYSLFRGSNYNLIGLLSRTNQANQEFQEETYLDMFIYRTGKKYGKKTVGLENVKSTTLNIEKAEAEMDRSEVDENKQAILKILKKRAYVDVLRDAYREKDLDLLDTLNMLSTPKSYNKAMLFDRNEGMSASMDSIMKTGSLFAAVGAAHLPGKNGMIEILRRKGYTVTPILSDYTEKGKKLKKQIEDYFVKPVFEINTTSDEMISLPLFPLVLKNGENLESPDLGNGGYINVKRMLLKDFITKKDEKFNHKTLDSLFFENIPGEILEKKSYQENNHFVYDIKSKTKTGKNERYRYYITPLEIIAVIMSGEVDYVRKYEDEVYNNIKIKTYKQEVVTFLSDKENFKVNIPSYHTIFGNKKDNKVLENTEIYAFDEQENAHYFVLENTLMDYANLEDSEYELKRMHYEFYNVHELDSTQTKFESNKFEFTSQSKLKEKNIYLKSALRGNKYYLLGTVNASKNKVDTFFNSFEITKSKENIVYKTFKDSTAHFSVEIPKQENEYLDFKFERKNIDKEEGKTNHFEVKFKSYEIFSPNKNIIEMTYSQPHRYESYVVLDTLFNQIKKNIAVDFEFKNYSDDNEFHTSDYATVIDSAATGAVNFNSAVNSNDSNEKDKFNPLDYKTTTWNKTLALTSNQKLDLVDEKFTKDENNEFYVYEVLATKPKSTQAIKYKIVLKKGEYYTFTTLVDKNYKNDNPFIEKVFNSFKVDDASITSRTFFENKFSFFEDDLYSEHDSIRYSAIKSFNNLTIEESDFPKIKNLLENFEFRKDEMDFKGELFESIGSLKSPEALPFLEQAYKKLDVSTQIQFSILRALALQKSKAAYKKIAELLDYDSPISENYVITGLFNLFISDLENSQVLYPNILEYYSINEFHEPIVHFVQVLLNSEKVTAKKLKSYKKMLLTNAKLEYKRLVSWKSDKEASNTEDDNNYDEENGAPVEAFNSYLSILYSYKNEKYMRQLYEKAEKLNIDDLNVAIANRELARNKKLDKSVLEKLISQPKTKYTALQMLYHNKQTEELTAFSKDSIVMNAIHYYEDFDKKNDSIVLLDEKIVTHNDKKISYFFYKKINIEADSYGKNSEKLNAIAFVHDENKQLNLKAFRRFDSKKIIEDKEITQSIKTMINESLNDNHLRVNFSSNLEEENYEEDAYYEE
ncbi:MAG: hypothetical protein CK517_00150 [Flavobacteriales bacterium]|nr:MAG: hypothetical protein CK517_00150 [Flavobacteriales bacterium]